MKNKTLFAVLLFVLILSACAPAKSAVDETAITPAATLAPVIAAEPTLTGVPAPDVPAAKVPALPVETVTYSDETFGLLIDFPADWVFGQTQIIGDRASQTLMTSPDSASQVSVTLYQWDPQNDLAAYADHRKLAWDASGFKILSEDEWVLDNGQSLLVYTFQTPDQQAFFVFALAGDRYLEFSGTGDLALIEQIALTLRFAR